MGVYITWVIYRLGLVLALGWTILFYSSASWLADQRLCVMCPCCLWCPLCLELGEALLPFTWNAPTSAALWLFRYCDPLNAGLQGGQWEDLAAWSLELDACPKLRELGVWPYPQNCIDDEGISNIMNHIPWRSLLEILHNWDAKWPLSYITISYSIWYSTVLS